MRYAADATVTFFNKLKHDVEITIIEKKHLVSYIFGVAKLFADHLSVSQGVMCCFDFCV